MGKVENYNLDLEEDEEALGMPSFQQFQMQQAGSGPVLPQPRFQPPAGFQAGAGPGPHQQGPEELFWADNMRISFTCTSSTTE